MKSKATIAVIAVPVILAGIIAFHPGVAYAGSPLEKLGPTPFKQAASYTVDAMHTFTGFDINHLGLSRVQGRFDKLSGALHVDPKDLTKSDVSFTIQADSVDTAVAPRDADLKSANFFDVEKYPTLEFKSTKISQRGKGYVAEGTLTIHGVTKTVSIPFKKYGPITDPWGGTRIGILAEPIVIKRSDYGMNFDATTIGDDVNIRISLEATLAK